MHEASRKDSGRLETLVEAATDPEERAAVLCAAEAGLRSGEVRMLQRPDIDFKHQVLTVRRTEYRGHIGSPKGGQLRRVAVAGPLTRTLKEARHLRGVLVFGYRDGRSGLAARTTGC